VLRARLGQQFDIAADGRVRVGRVVSLGDDRVEFELGEEVPAAAETQVTLLLAIFKFDRLEWAIEKCTELGVARVVPLIASRTDVHLAKAAAKRVERWRHITREASEQSRRAAPPEIAAPVKLNPATLDAVGGDNVLRIVLAESEEDRTLKQVLATCGAGKSLALAIGPEGGWTGDELQLFVECGWKAASLGQTILRAETAAIAALAIAMAEIS
jgi:16S rRNA (uracil1498-N3)-methyltransferase